MPKIGQLRKQFFPWTIDVDVFLSPKSNINFSTLYVDARVIHCCMLMSSSAQNDEIAWDIIIPAGTWTIELLHHATNDRGLYSIQINGVEKGTISGYAASFTPNIKSTVTGIVIQTTAKIELKIKMTQIAPGSYSFMGAISGLQLKRTA